MRGISLVLRWLRHVLAPPTESVTEWADKKIFVARSKPMGGVRGCRPHGDFPAFLHLQPASSSAQTPLNMATVDSSRRYFPCFVPSGAIDPKFEVINGFV